MSFFAHSTPRLDRRDWEPLRDHLTAVAHSAAAAAAKFDAEPLGHTVGLLHDLGKYSPDFQQKRLIDKSGHVDHAAPGARVAIDRFGPQLGKLLAFGIAGHHAGLADATIAGSDGAHRTPLDARLRGLHQSAARDLALAVKDGVLLPDALPVPALRPRGDMLGFQLQCLGRMLFSCLVDADFLETERFYAKIEGRPLDRGGFPALPDLADTFRFYLSTMLGNAAATPVNRLRADILAHVRAQAAESQGVFTLTVPTGGGKTLTSLAFALEHARRHKLDRVIVVIPFTSVIDQTADVYRRALGGRADAVLEHHSAFDETRLRGLEGHEKLKLAMENWAAPIVVTTAVQFFESLFADRPSRCRKLHNIARSVVVLDEAQTLPQQLLRPCVAMLDELARNYRTTVVLSTATQPALIERNDANRSFKGGFREARELAPDVAGLFRALKRVRVRNAGSMSDEDVAKRLADSEEVLCIVNTRKHAHELFERIRGLPGARHLSTLMCAVHRRRVLAAIRENLKAHRPCRVVSTSLIEAGVDVDFSLVLRAEAGLDSVAQAAGRCNREGTRDPERSEVVVFISPDHPPPRSMRTLCDAGRAALRRFGDDPLCPEAIEFFFREFYWTVGEAMLDGPGILAACNTQTKTFDFPYATIASQFRMIDDIMQPVIVPYDAEARRQLNALRHAQSIGGIARALQPYIVPIPARERDNLIRAGAAEIIREAEFSDRFVALTNVALYSEETGLFWDDPTHMEAASLIA